jgi:hypothetical protein
MMAGTFAHREYMFRGNAETLEAAGVKRIYGIGAAPQWVGCQRTSLDIKDAQVARP